MGTHKHHIIPKHMGGTDEPSNLIELTVEEHANAHKLLWEENGRWQDFVAWKALSGQISTDDLRKELARLANQGRSLSEEHKNKIKEARSRQITSEETRLKMSKTRKGRTITWDLKRNTPEANEKRSKKMIGISKAKVQCPHCSKVGGKPQMYQWHFDNCKGKK